MLTSEFQVAKSEADRKGNHDGVRNVSRDMSSRRWFLVVVAFCLVVAACGSDDSPSLGDATSSTIQETTVSTLVESVPTTDTPAIPLLANTRWVRLDFEAIVDERDQSIVEVGEVVLGATMVKRDIDGTVFYATVDGVFQIEPGAVEPTRLFDGEVFSLARDEGGVVLASTPLGMLNPASGEYVDTPVPDVGSVIVAANGMAVELLPGSFRLDAEGWISHVQRPDGIRLLDERGDQTAVWELGGSGAPLLSLVDFDGRLIVAARGPEEPALPAWDHFVIDLKTGSVDVFKALPGTIALATADDPILPSVLQIPAVDLCPTWSPVVAKEPDQSLPDAVADGYRDAILAVARCDTWFIGRAIEWDDAAGWNALQRSLLGPPTVSDRTWSWGIDPAATVTIDAQGYVEVAVTFDDSVDLRIVRGETDLVVTGRVGTRTAARLTEVAATTADRHDLDLTTYLSEGPELDEQTQAAIEEFLGTSLGLGGNGIVALEARLTADSIRVWAVREDDLPIVVGEVSAAAFQEAGLEVDERVDAPGVAVSETQILEDLVAFAVGDGDAASRIPWASEVVLAFGPILADVRPAQDLSDPAVWTVDVGPFRGGDGAVSLLPTATIEWAAPVEGPHRHCASPPVPAPPALAGLRRISIQAAGIDSCLQWRTLDLFLDADGQVAGVSCDVWEP